MSADKLTNKAADRRVRDRFNGPLENQTAEYALAVAAPIRVYAVLFHVKEDVRTQPRPDNPALCCSALPAVPVGLFPGYILPVRQLLGLVASPVKHASATRIWLAQHSQQYVLG